MFRLYQDRSVAISNFCRPLSSELFFEKCVELSTGMQARSTLSYHNPQRAETEAGVLLPAAATLERTTDQVAMNCAKLEPRKNKHVGTCHWRDRRQRPVAGLVQVRTLVSGWNVIGYEEHKGRKGNQGRKSQIKNRFKKDIASATKTNNSVKNEVCVEELICAVRTWRCTRQAMRLVS